MTIHRIHYRILLGNNTPGLLPILPSEQLKHPILSLFGVLPHSLEHVEYGHSYYKLIADSVETSGYEFMCIYINDLSAALDTVLLPHHLYVFLICTDDVNHLKIIDSELSKRHQPTHVYLASEAAKAVLTVPNVFTGTNDLLAFICDYAKKNGVSELPTCNPVSQKLHDSALSQYWFAPCTTNLMTIKAMLGEFLLDSTTTREEQILKIAEESTKACNNLQSFDRQNNLAQQISDMRQIEQDTLEEKPTSTQFVDQYLAPLVVAYPFISIDFRKTLIDQIVKNGGDKTVGAHLKEVLSHEQTPNYGGEFNAQKTGAGHFLFGMKTFHQDRHQFIDFCASLHCSMRFSPYLRLPLSGKSFNTELSSVGPDQGARLVSSSNARKVVRQIQKVGERMSAKLAPSILSMLKYQPCQIVALTDLPIEWMEIEGVPLGFSHDVCRIPETPISGMLTHYVINIFTPYTVPRDIIKRTLVVYGCTSPEFKKWQDRVEEMKQQLGFNTCECKTIDEFEKAVKYHKPDFLIIDTHGDVDMVNHQSYLLIGNEKLYPQEIAKRGITARIVFLSACMTAPTYNDVNTPANAFLEVGAQAVTSSYLPLDIDESSLLYCRLLSLLPEAASKAFHHNWLSFISHVQRTSYIMAPSMRKSSDSHLWLNALKSGIVNAGSMLFANRRKLFEDLQNGTLPGTDYKADYSQIIPHYLLYSTIGRADLIEFESSRENF